MPERANAGQILGGSITLAATLLGGGGAVVPLAYEVRASGYILAPLLLIAAAAWTLYTSWVLLYSSGLTKKDSYESIAGHTLGWLGSYVVSIFIIVNAFLIDVSVQGLAIDLIRLVEPFDGFDRVPLMLLGGIVLLPITAVIRRVDRLQPLGAITAITALFFLGFVVKRYAFPNEAEAARREVAVSPFSSGEEANTIWLQALCTITIAFVVQFNVLPVGSEWPQETILDSTMTALYIGIGLAFTIYVCSDLLSYFTYGDVSYDETMDDYRHTPFGGIAIFQLGIGQLLSYPILAHAAVTESSKWLEPCCAIVRRYRAQQRSATPAAPSEKSELIDPEEKWSAGPLNEVCMSELIAGTLWVVAGTVVSAAATDVSSVLALTGASCATPLMTVFPPLMLLGCAEWWETKPPLAAQLFHGAMLLSGVLMTGAGTVLAIINF